MPSILIRREPPLALTDLFCGGSEIETMKRRSFVGCLLSLFAYPFAKSELPSRVKVVQYIDPRYIGREFRVIGERFVDGQNQHYRRGVPCVILEGDGVILHAYRDEIVAA